MTRWRTILVSFATQIWFIHSFLFRNVTTFLFTKLSDPKWRPSKGLSSRAKKSSIPLHRCFPRYPMPSMGICSPATTPKSDDARSDYHWCFHAVTVAFTLPPVLHCHHRFPRFHCMTSSALLPLKIHRQLEIEIWISGHVIGKPDPLHGARFQQVVVCLSRFISL